MMELGRFSGFPLLFDNPLLFKFGLLSILMISFSSIGPCLCCCKGDPTFTCDCCKVEVSMLLLLEWTINITFCLLFCKILN